MKELILFAMRDFISKIIKQYIQYQRDIGTPENDQENTREEMKYFENWLYMVMKNESALWKD